MLRTFAARNDYYTRVTHVRRLHPHSHSRILPGSAPYINVSSEREQNFSDQTCFHNRTDAKLRVLEMKTYSVYHAFLKKPRDRFTIFM